MSSSDRRVQLSKDLNGEMKAFFPLDSLITHLSEKLAMSEKEIELAQDFLRCYNYYSFSVFVKQVPNNILAGKFQAAVTLYEFNEWLSHSLFNFSGRLEQFIKATFIESLCGQYTGDYQKGECYLDESIYETEALYQEFIEIIEKHLSENQSLSIQHHISNKNSKFPIWVLFQEMTFGETTRFISSLKKDFREQWIESAFLSKNIINPKIHGEEIKSKLFGWVSAVWYMRNRTAHHLRLYGQNFTVATPSFFSSDLRKINRNAMVKKQKTHNKDLFAYLLAMKNLIQYHSAIFIQDWNHFLITLEANMIGNPAIILASKIGFPSNWKQVLWIDE
ncbi:Abi family protein [Streptococcus pneumoniae]